MIGLRISLAGSVKNYSAFSLLCPLFQHSTLVKRSVSILARPQLLLLRPVLPALHFQSSQSGTSGAQDKNEEGDDEEDKAAKPSRVRRPHPREGDSQVDARPPPRRGLKVVEHSPETSIAYLQSEGINVIH